MFNMQLVNLKLLSAAEGFSIWHYRHDGRSEETLEEGFFDGVMNLATHQDVVYVKAKDRTLVGFLELDKRGESVRLKGF